MKRQSVHRKSTVQIEIVKRNQYFWFPIKMFVTLSLTIFASSTRHQKDFVYETWADYFKWKFNARTFPELIFNFKQLVHLNFAHILIIESNIIIWQILLYLISNSVFIQMPIGAVHLDLHSWYTYLFFGTGAFWRLLNSQQSRVTVVCLIFAWNAGSFVSFLFIFRRWL